MTVIFSTIHGSRLYGLSHAGSDHDTFTVVTDDHDFAPGERGQRVRGFGDSAQDDIVFTLDDFLAKVNKGAHQSCEALFSTVKVYSSFGVRYAPMLEGIRVTSPDAFHTYERTIKKFSFGDFKRRRHAVRLASDLWQLRRQGGFDPTMRSSQIAIANNMASSMEGEELFLELDRDYIHGYTDTNSTK